MADSPSPGALWCLARWFAGPRDELRSHEPHETLSKVKAGMDELVALGFVTREEFNRAGSLLFKPTEKARGIGWAERQRLMREMGLLDETPTQSPPDPASPLSRGEEGR